MVLGVPIDALIAVGFRLSMPDNNNQLLLMAVRVVFCCPLSVLLTLGFIMEGKLSN